MTDLPRAYDNLITQESLPTESLFVIDSSNPWYGDILIYFQTQNFQPHLSKDDCQCICHQARHYLIFSDTLYYRGVDMVLQRRVTHNEANFF